jgi:Circadian oscillating protein COP23
MKLGLFGQVLTGFIRVFTISSLCAFATTLTINQPSYAEGITFYCGKNKEVPATIARTPKGEVSVIRWTSNDYFPPPWTAEQRCQQVSLRFQRNYDNGTLRYITTGTFNGETVVCAAIRENSPCTDKTLLFTLKRGTNPNATVRRLVDRRALAVGITPEENGHVSDNHPINIDIGTYINRAKLE